MNTFINSGWLANSNFKQSLVEHSVAVALQALTLFREQSFALNEEKTSFKGYNKKVKIAEASIVAAGLYHDLGKITPKFQSMLRGDEEESTNLSNEQKWVYFRHEEVSYALIKGIGSLSSSISEDAAYAIFYHHAKDNRDFSKYSVEKILSFAMENKPESEGMEELQTWIARFNEQALAVAVKIQEQSKNQVVLDGCAYIIALLEKIAVKQDEDEDVGIKNGSMLPPVFFRNASQGALSLSSFYPKENAWRLLLRSILVSADRLVSAMPELMEKVDYSTVFSFERKNQEALLSTIADMRQKFPVAVRGNRSFIQEDMAKKLSTVDGVAVLQGPAGCGKTKIALQWFEASMKGEKRPNRLFIITPRKVVASGLYSELTKEGGKYGFGAVGAATVELLTGEDKWLFKDGAEIKSEEASFEGDIVVLTIDQVISMAYSHKKIDILMDFVNSAVVFDEYHEFFNISGMVVMVKIILDLLEFYKTPQVLLVSATPNLYFLNELGVKGVYLDEKGKTYSRTSNMFKVDTFNNKPMTFNIRKYQAEDKNESVLKENEANAVNNEVAIDNQESVAQEEALREKWSMYGEEFSPGDMFVFNTASDSQKSALRALRSREGGNKGKVVNFHSRLTPKHRREVSKRVYEEWGEENQKECVRTKAEPKAVLFSGPIVQASLDISTSRMFTEECSAENMLQRMGRLNRFALYEESTFVLNVVVQNNARKVTNTWKFFKSEKQILTWSESLQEKFIDGQKVFLYEMYNFYYEYQKKESAKEAYREDFKEVLVNSQEILEKNMFAPIRYRVKKEEKEQKQKKLSQYSLRAASSYVLAPIFNEVTEEITWLSSSAEQLDNHLTLEDDNLRGFLKNYIEKKIDVYKENHGLRYIYDFPKMLKNHWVKVEDGKYQVREGKECISYLLRSAKSPESPVILNTVKDFKKSLKGQVYMMYGETPIGLMNITTDSQKQKEVFTSNNEQ